jgi:hypothetical protein
MVDGAATIRPISAGGGGWFFKLFSRSSTELWLGGGGGGASSAFLPQAVNKHSMANRPRLNPDFPIKGQKKA